MFCWANVVLNYFISSLIIQFVANSAIFLVASAQVGPYIPRLRLEYDSIWLKPESIKHLALQ